MFGFRQMDNHPLAEPQSLATIAPYFFKNISFDSTQCTLLILYIFILVLFLFLVICIRDKVTFSPYRYIRNGGS